MLVKIEGEWVNPDHVLRVTEFPGGSRIRFAVQWENDMHLSMGPDEVSALLWPTEKAPEWPESPFAPLRRT